jgi:autotransporter-associated beta strand protein
MNKKIISQNVSPLTTLPCRPMWTDPQTSAAVKTVADATKHIISTMMAMAVFVLFAASASAQSISFTTDTTAEQYGDYQNANGGLLNIGRTMTVTGAGIEVFQLGVFDYQSDGLATAHTVTLFDSTQMPIASVTVPAGTAAPLINAFRFAPLGTPLFLPAGNYSILAYQMNSGDPYGNGNAPGFNGGGNVSPGAGVYHFTSNPSPDYWTDMSGENFASASFTYTNVSPATGIWTGGGTDNNWRTAGNWNGLPIFPAELTFAGSTARLVNNNDNTGITVDGITFDSAAGAFVLNGNDITLAGSIGFSADGIGLSVNPPAPVTQTINLNMALSASETIDTPTNGNLTLGGNITSSVDTSLIKLDAGTLTLGGANAIQSWDLNGGTTTITGNTTINGGGGSSLIYVGDGDYLGLHSGNGTLDIEPGAVLNITGTFGDTFVIGRDGGSGTVIQNGGTFTFNPANNPSAIVIGATSNPGTQSEYDMKGGTLDMSGNTLYVGLGDHGATMTGMVHQVSGDIVNLFKLDLGALTATGTGIYTLSGGSITIDFGGIVSDDGLYAINLGGGTVGAYSDWLSSLNMNLTGSNGPVTFDTAGSTITLSGALSGTGGLTVAGGGTLELSGANSYTGDTVVNAGSTLELGVAGGNQTSLRLANDSTLNLNYSGNYTVTGFYTNGVALPNGTYNSGNLSTFITGNPAGNLVVASIAISQDLVPVTKFVGSPAVLTVVALGSNVHYYWYRNTVLLPSQTNSTLNFAAVALSDDANYSVTVSNAVGTVSSSTVHLTVLQQTLTHRYSMDDATVTDSVGGANGTPTTGNVTFSGGQAHIPGDGGGVNIPNGDYINLPPGLITGYNSVSMEFWATIWKTTDDGGAWNWLAGFGNQNTRLIVVDKSGAGNDSRMTIQTGGSERVAGGAPRLDNGVPVHIVAVWNADQNVQQLYENGKLVAVNSTPIDLSNISDDLNVLGRGFYGDPNPHCSIDEFRIWNGPLTPLQISVNDGLGADVVNTNPGAFLNLSSVSVPSTMLVGSSRQATALATFANVANVVFNSQVTNWVSSSPSVATVDGSGLVTAVGAGTTTISATAQGSTATSALISVSLSAQTVAYTANVNIGTGFFGPINMGHIFNVSGAGIEVFQLGYFDAQNHPLFSPHTVTLFDSTLTAIASVTVPAGATNLLGGFAFVPLPTPINLPAGQYTVLGYGVSHEDPNGEEGGWTSFNGSANLTDVAGCYDFTSQGSPDYPGGPGDVNTGYGLTWDNSTATASFTYVNAATTPPVVNPVVVSGGNLILTGSGGTAGAGYTWLSTTNLSAPITWSTNTTGNFDGSGNFSNAIPVTTSTPAQFFRLRTP